MQKCNKFEHLRFSR